MKKCFYWIVGLLLFVTACSSGGGGGETAVSTSSTSSQTNNAYDEYEIVTLLPQDAIPAIDNPEFLSVAEADGSYLPDELVIGVEFNGDARAYSVPLLSSHEIVNDTVGGEKIAVTW